MEKNNEYLASLGASTGARLPPERIRTHGTRRFPASQKRRAGPRHMVLVTPTDLDSLLANQQRDIFGPF